VSNDFVEKLGLLIDHEFLTISKHLYEQAAKTSLKLKKKTCQQYEQAIISSLRSGI